MRDLIRTVRGDISPDDLGVTDYHEHLFQESPLLRGDELDDEELSRREFAELRDSGIRGVVDATPIGLGRRPRSVLAISRSTGLHIVQTTGVHRSAHYGSSHWLFELTPAWLARLLIAELQEGVAADDQSPTPAARTSSRAGMLKVGIDYWSIDAFAHRAIEAVGTAHRATGAPVMIHLEYATAATEVLALLADNGVPSTRVVLAHVDRNPDPGLLGELAAQGAYLGFDGMARYRSWPDSVLLDCMSEIARSGWNDRLLVGGDVARRSRYRAYGGLPGLRYLGERFLPRMHAVLGRELTYRITVTNPARLLAWSGHAPHQAV